MVNRTPSYYIGTAFDETPAKKPILESVLTHLRSLVTKGGAGA